MIHKDHEGSEVIFMKPNIKLLEEQFRWLFTTFKDLTHTSDSGI